MCIVYVVVTMVNVIHKIIPVPITQLIIINRKRCNLSPIECEIGVEDVSLSMNVDLIYDQNGNINNHTYKIDFSSINNSIEQRLFGKHYKESLI